jgi:hypothetical protein
LDLGELISKKSNMKTEELEEAAESRYGTDMDSIRGSNVYDLNTDLKRGFVEGAKWQAERMYSEEDFKLFARQYYREIRLNKSNLLWDDLADKCLEQFKKK